MVSWGQYTEKDEESNVTHARPAQYERETAHHQSDAKMPRHPEIEENELELRPTNQAIHRSAAAKKEVAF